MAILKPTKAAEKATLRISIDKPLLEKIKAYMEFIGIKKYDDFFEQAAQFVFSKEKAWPPKEGNK